MTQIISYPKRQEFIQAIHRFEQQHRVALADFLIGRCWEGSCDPVEMEMITPEKAALREEFFKDKTITNYLARPADEISFVDYHPDFSIEETDKENNDYYECLIYRLASQEAGTFFLPYRQDVLRTELFFGGTHVRRIKEFYSKASSNSEITIDPPVDIYGIRQNITRIELQDRCPGATRTKAMHAKTVFLLSPNVKDLHATTVFSVFERITHKLLVSIFIDSNPISLSDGSDSYVRMEPRFNGEARVYMAYKEEAEAVHVIYQARLGNRKTQIDEKTREGYSLDPSSEEDITTELENAIEEGKIDIIHSIFLFCGEMPCYKVYDKRRLPFIAAPLDLQNEEIDQNCALYSANFIKGLIHMLEEVGNAERVYELAQNIASSKDATAIKDASEAMTQFVQGYLKKHLSCYYNADGSPKDKEELHAHHLKQRWNIGSANMQLKNLRELGYLPMACSS